MLIHKMCVPLGVVGLVVIFSLLRVWEVEVPSSNPTMGSAWEITLCSRLMLTSILNGVGCIIIAHLDPLLS